MKEGVFSFWHKYIESTKTQIDCQYETYLGKMKIPIGEIQKIKPMVVFQRP